MIFYLLVRVPRPSGSVLAQAKPRGGGVCCCPGSLSGRGGRGGRGPRLPARAAAPGGGVRQGSTPLKEAGNEVASSVARGLGRRDPAHRSIPSKYRRDPDARCLRGELLQV